MRYFWPMVEKELQKNSTKGSANLSLNGIWSCKLLPHAVVPPDRDTA